MEFECRAQPKNRMKPQNQHINHRSVDEQSKVFFAKGKFTYSKSEADVWANLEEQLSQPVKGRLISLNFNRLIWMVAASVVFVVLLGGSFIRFYTITVSSPAGSHLEAVLPDQSVVRMNAETSISYRPYWWAMSRKVELIGEAFFEVQKGAKFTVVSEKGLTQVLGTSFNIFAREDIYKVTCVTGLVKVKSMQGFEAIIKPNSKAEINERGEVNVISNIELFPELSWKKNIFLFTTKSVHEVFREIERQYGISILTQIDGQAFYSGNFSKDQHVEEILDYVCPALGLKYIRKSNKQYLIIQGDE